MIEQVMLPEKDREHGDSPGEYRRWWTRCGHELV